MEKVLKKEYCRARYPKGTLLRLSKPINDPYTPKKVGDIFVSSGVIDDMLQLHGHWLSGGSMALSIEDDEFEIIM